MEEADPDEATGLLDSGATHAVRARELKDQEVSAMEVVLAGGATQSLLQNRGGTILTEGPSQPIVPLGSLVNQLGCTVSWTPSRLTVKHPVFGKLRVKVRFGCPVVTEARALELIQQLEEKRLSKLRSQVVETEAILKALTSRVPLTTAITRARVAGSRADIMQTALFCGVFEHRQLSTIATSIPTEERELRRILKSLPLPRRRRRALESSRDWFINVGFGKENPHIQETVMARCPEAQVLHVDLSKPSQWNLDSGSDLWAILAWAAINGRIIGISAEVASRVPLLTQVSWMWAVASGGRGYTIPIVATSGNPKVFQEHWWAQFQSWSCLRGFEALCGRVMGFTNCRSERMESSKDHQEFQRSALESFISQQSQPVSEEELRAIDRNVREALRAVSSHPGPGMQEPNSVGTGEERGPSASAMDAEAWRRHVAKGHLPFNRRCRACVMGSGVGLQHRKVMYPTSFSLSWDVLGPIQKGIFEDSVASQPRHKYALIGAYRVPEEVVQKTWDPKEDLKELFSLPALELAAAGAYLGGEFKDGPVRPKDEEVLPPLPEVPEEEEGIGSEEWTQAHEDLQGSEVSVEIEVASEPPEELARAAEALDDPVRQVVLRFVRPMTSRKGPSVMPALHSMIQEINKLGFPVKNVHSDQGREFLSDPLKQWLSQLGVRVTMSEAHDKRANGLAERIVGWSKQRARCLLNSADLPPNLWPYAMTHATAAHQAHLLGDKALPYFGKPVIFKRPMLPGNYKPWDHWSEGRYLAPSILVPGGHSVLKEDGNTTVVKNFRHDLVNPEEILRTEDRGLLEAKEVVEDALSVEVEGADPLFPELFDGDLLEGVDRMPDPSRGDGKPGNLGPAAIVVDPPPRSRLKGKGPSIRPKVAMLRELESSESEEEPDEITDTEAQTISSAQISSLGSSSSGPSRVGPISDPTIIRALTRLSLEARAEGLYELGVREVGDLNYVFRADLVEEGIMKLRCFYTSAA